MSVYQIVIFESLTFVSTVTMIELSAKRKVENQMANMIINKVLYIGEWGYEVFCEDCAGLTLRGSIQNGKSNQTHFKGLHGETFWQTSAHELGLDCWGKC